MKALPSACGCRVSRACSIAASVLAFFAGSSHARAWTSARVQVDGSGHLTYPADANGNRIPDFSNAGYMGGGVALPTIPVVKTISPVSGDNTAAIQAAIDAVGAMPVQPNGYRGALMLSAGLYGVTGTIHINHTGVVLAGAGNGSDPKTNTVLQRTGTSTAEVIIAGGGSADNFQTVVSGSTSNITDAVVQVGAHSFNVDNPGLYKVGDSIVIFHPSTQAWINAVDTSKVWTAGQVDIRYLRTITAISGNTITIDAPVFNTLAKSLAQSTVYKYARSGYVTNVGIQDLFIDIVTNGPTSEDHCTDVITFVQAENCWIRDTTTQHFVHAGVMFGGSAIHCTALRCKALSPNSVITGGRRYNFATYHAQCILFDSCYGSEGRHTFVSNGTSDDCCIVALNGTIDHPHASSEGHRLWPTGMLFDGIKTVNYVSADAPDVMGFYNRGTFGSGHGWAAANSVIWNCNAAGGHIMVQQPPTAQNYAIGCFGNVDGNGPFTGGPGYIEGSNVSGLSPASLYLAQLADRLGSVTPQAAAPAFSPAAGTYTSAQSVTITSATGGASIRYTTDGSAPSETNGTLYTGNPVGISSTTTLQAIAFETGFTDSSVTSGLYTITMPKAATPTFSPVSGTYNNDQSVTISSATTGASINYTTDGSLPTETNGILYGGPVSVNATMTLQAIAFASGFADSTVSVAPYTLAVAPVIFSPPGGNFATAQSLTLSTATIGATIRYSTDGSTPGNVYTGPISIAGNTTIKAMASKPGYEDSPIASATYTIGAVPVTLEAESLSPVGTGATVSISNDANASGGVVEFLNSTAAGQTITFTTPAIAAGTYQVQLRYKTNTSRGQHTVKVDGVQVGGTIDQYATTSAYTTATLGNATLSGSGTHTIVMTVTGKNSAATQFYLTADTFTFTPVSAPPPAAAPVFSPGGGSYQSTQMVTITSATSGASIRYTTDGSAPTETHGTLYSSPVSIVSSTTLMAIAYKSGFTDSTVTTATYSISIVEPPPPISLEAESISPVGTGATVSTSSDANASGGVVEFLNSTAAGQVMTFTTPSIPAGTYQFQLRYWANTTRGQHTVKVDGTQVGGTIDQYATAKAYVTVTLGNVTFATAGTHSIAMTVTGKNSAATQFYLTADKFTFNGQ